MNDIGGAFVIPLMVGICSTLVEYFLIQPIKAPPPVVDYISSVLKLFIALLISVIAFFLLVLVIQNISLFEGRGFGSNFPYVVSFLNHPSYAFAATIYAVISVFVIFNRHRHFAYIIAIIPPILIVLWSVAFIIDLDWLIFLILGVGVLWSYTCVSTKNSGYGLCLWFASPTLLFLLYSVLRMEPLGVFLVVCLVIWTLLALFLVIVVLASDEKGADEFSSGVFFTTLFICWPVNSLLLIRNNFFSELWGWLISFGFLVFQISLIALIAYVFLQNGTNTQARN